jgi:asparagine synthase (glutamine-hydrolysing)
VLGLCAADDRDVERMARDGVPEDAAWRWPGTYAVIEERPDVMVLYTDPAATRPLYAARYRGGWVWSSSARLLAALTGAPVDVQQLAAALLAPAVPALAGHRSFFTGVELLPPGARVHLLADGGQMRHRIVWRPRPATQSPTRQLRAALLAAAAVRAHDGAALSCDLSGGLDSTSVALAAARHLPDGRVLTATTVHPEGNTAGADLRYACRAADTDPSRIQHHLMPLGADHAPYTGLLDGLPATDEPAPSTIARARFFGQMRWLHDALGARLHMTGDGGDSVLFVPPAHLADLLRHRRWRRSCAEALGWARLRHRGPAGLLRDAVRTAHTPRSAALAALARTLEGSVPARSGSEVAWFPALAAPAWATGRARELAADAARTAAQQQPPAGGVDAAVLTLLDEVRETARTAAADAELAASCGIELHNPFLDPTVVDTLVGLDVDQRPPLHTYKPLLGEAMADLLPLELARRTTKGSFDSDHYAGMRRNLNDLLHLADGHLAALGLLHPNLLRACLRKSAAGIPLPLTAVEPALATEAWLRARRATPAVPWTSEPAEALR